MKKLRYIGLIAGLIILFNSNSNAQYYYTSYGNAQDWYLPGYVHSTLYDNYYGFEIAHVQRLHKHGHQNYNVLLHRNGWFVELRFDHHGHIYKTIRHRNNYPLISHNCTHHCGYHKTYYQTYYPKYHYGYHKTVYVTSNGQGYYNNHNNYYTNVYVEKQHNKKPTYQGNNQGHGKNNNSVQQNANRSNEPRVIRQPEPRSKQNVEQARPQNNSRMQQAPVQQVTRQNTSRGATRSTMARNGRSQ
jgi:hypothetical protein